MPRNPFDEEPPTRGGGPQEIEGELLQPVAAGALPPGSALMRTGTGYTTAMQVQKKRDLNEVQRSLLEEAALMGEGAFYGWGVGGDRVEGPSQELALAAARVWGNCAVEPGPVQDAGDAWIIPTYFIDLQTGFTYGRPFRMSKKWVVHGKLDAERKTDVRFQIGATKSARNAILKALPGWLIDKAMDQAKAGVRAKLEKYIANKGMAAAQDLALSLLAKAGVKEEAILRKFGIAEKKAISVDNLIVMQGDIRALQAGEARADEIYPQAQEAAAAGVSSMDAFAGAVAATEQRAWDAAAAKSPQEPQSQPTPTAGANPSTAEPQRPASGLESASQSKAEPPVEGERLSDGQVADLEASCLKAGVSLEKLRQRLGVPLKEYRIAGQDAAAAERAVQTAIAALVARSGDKK